jgi:Domain of unknown function (DUF3846)
MKAVIITTEGEKSVVEFDNDSCYEMLKNAVGGLIECVPLRASGFEMWVNEEGKLMNLPQNGVGTALWNDNYGPSDVTVGNIVLTGGTDSKGNTLGLTDEQLEFVLNYDKSIVIQDLNIEDYISFEIHSGPDALANFGL